MTRARFQEHEACKSDPIVVARFVEVVFGYLDGFAQVRLLAETGALDKSICQQNGKAHGARGWLGIGIRHHGHSRGDAA